jgi:hypothetical protein
MLSATLIIPVAGSIILSITQDHSAIHWTQDEHFKDLPDVKCIKIGVK